MQRLSNQEFVDRFASQAGWGLLVGSAVSASPPTWAPMVGPALWAIFTAIAEELTRRNRTRVPDLRAIWKRVDRGTFIANLKLEVALSHLETHKPGAAAAVVEALYANKSSNCNHRAIASLHTRGWARFILTTNFDAGLEATGLFTGIDTKMPREGKILKLHGDADSGLDLIATMEGLTTGRNFRLAQGALEACLGLGMTRLLVVGYSGVGDIDILPAIIATTRKEFELWWGLRHDASPPPGVQVAGVVTHDLSTPTENVLCRLAGSVPGLEDTAFPSLADAERRGRAELGPFVRELSTDQLVGMAVSLLLESNFGWQPAKLLLASERLFGLRPNHNQWHLACERMSAYTAAERHLKRSTLGARGMEVQSALARRAFIVQEAGRTAESRDLFRSAFDGFTSARDGAEAFQHLDFVLRGFLESEIRRCGSFWNERRRSILAAELLERCRALEEQAHQHVPSVSAVLKLRRAQLSYISAKGSSARRAALALAEEALGDAIALQHSDGVAVASRFIISTGLSGWQRVRRTTRGYERTTRRPARETLKMTLAIAQGLVPNSLLPWKLQVPFAGFVKRMTDHVMTMRLRLRLALWKHEYKVDENADDAWRQEAN